MGGWYFRMTWGQEVCYDVNQSPHWACWQYGYSGGTLGYCKAHVSRSENEIASYWYHNVLLGMPLNLVMGSEAINTSYLTDWYVGFTLKMESDCKAYVSWSENDIASYWYHNVLLEMPLYLVMGSEVKRTFQSLLGYWTHAQITSFKPQEGRKIIVWQQGVPSSCRVSDN